MLRSPFAIALVLLSVGCGKTAPVAPTAAQSPRADSANWSTPKPPLFEGLGGYTWSVTTSVPEAQKYFDQGLAFLYGFNHDEAARSFAYAAELDPACAMAHWGVAMANGPHINNPTVDPDRASAAWIAVNRAKKRASGGLPVERALVEAVATRYSASPTADRKPLDRAFAAAMKKVWKAFPGDADVGAIYVESIMMLRPWDYWASEGKAREGLEDMMPTLDRVLVIVQGHPLANHLYIHALESTAHPEKAEAVADRLRLLQPGLGHMVHMPSHIDVRLGHWVQAIEANERAVAADTAYRKLAPRPAHYNVYIAHNHHMLAYAAMMVGRSNTAIQAVRGMIEVFPTKALEDKELAAVLDGYMAMPLEVLVRFGRWDEVLKEPEVKGPFPIYAALRHAARAVAYAAKSNMKSAANEQRAFAEAKAAVGKSAKFGNNSGAAILDVAERFVSGEVLARSGKLDEAIHVLREAVRREDALAYDEPPDWIIPVRHALGATLLKAKKPKDAEKVYREDLAKAPDNGWSLWGLARSLKTLGRPKEMADVDNAFLRVWKGADVELSSSCFCQPGD